MTNAQSRSTQSLPSAESLMQAIEEIANSPCEDYQDLSRWDLMRAVKQLARELDAAKTIESSNICGRCGKPRSELCGDDFIQLSKIRELDTTTEKE